MTKTALEIAYYFIEKADRQSEMSGELLTNLKLQKLLYFSQGLFCARFDKPLFADNIVAWQYGPAVESVFFEFKSHGAQGICYNNSMKVPVLTVDETEILNDVYDYFMQFSAYRLMEMLAEDALYKNTEINAIISIDLMRRHFYQYLNHD